MMMHGEGRLVPRTTTDITLYEAGCEREEEIVVSKLILQTGLKVCGSVLCVFVCVFQKHPPPLPASSTSSSVVASRHSSLCLRVGVLRRRVCWCFRPRQSASEKRALSVLFGGGVISEGGESKTRRGGCFVWQLCVEYLCCMRLVSPCAERWWRRREGKFLCVHYFVE